MTRFRIFLALFFSLAQNAIAEEDPYLWLEEMHSEEVVNWVQNQTQICSEALTKHPAFPLLQERALDSLNAKEAIAGVSKSGDFFYNFWDEEGHPKGFLRRTSLKSYLEGNPEWETVLDIDALAEEEQEDWVFAGCQALSPGRKHALIFLSRGGKDACVVREFDLETKTFILEGFILPEAKTSVVWKDENTVLVATDFGPNSLTISGYPKIVKEWKRGESLESARTLFEGNDTDVRVYGQTLFFSDGSSLDTIVQTHTFFTHSLFLCNEGKWEKLEKPEDASVSWFQNQFLFYLESDWQIDDTTYAAGSILAISREQYLKGNRSFTALFVPTEQISLQAWSSTQNFVFLHLFENAETKIIVYKFQDGAWNRVDSSFPSSGNAFIQPVDPENSDDYFLWHTDFLTPQSLYFGNLEEKVCEKLTSSPSFFDASQYVVTRHEATSLDGTKIPYVQIGKKDLICNSANPTLLYGYGGFGCSLSPTYLEGAISYFLEQGGVYVQALIRGGGEFGPLWHEAARLENRQNAFDDFIAVAEDLQKRGVTSPKHLGIRGGSNGGLLVGVAMTQRPDLFGAVICEVPLLDMLRYHMLLAGSSWIDEYGNPEIPEHRVFLEKYSPYHHVQEETQYPPVLFYTSAADDRVHPGHARKMAAKMKAMGHDVFLYESGDGGHSAGSDNQKTAFLSALKYAFLFEKLKNEALK